TLSSYCSPPLRDLHSVPTRRSSDLGYEAAHYEVSMRMAELDLLPAVRAADTDTLLVADGTSCRHQIRDGTGREAIHVARVLERRSEEHTSELQSRENLVCRLLLEKK